MSLLFFAALILPACFAFLFSLLFIRIYLSQKKKREILLQGAKEFLNADVLLSEIRKELTGTRSFEKLMILADKQVDDFLRIRLVKELPYVGMLIGEQTIVALKKVFMKEMETLFPTVMNQYMDSLQQEWKTETMINEKVAEIGDDKISKLFSPINRFIIYWSVLLGLLIGVLQALLVLLLLK